MLKARSCDYRLLNNLQQMHLKLLQKEQLKKEQKPSSVRLAKKFITKFQKNQKFHHRIGKGQLEMKQKLLDVIVKYQKKYIYLQKIQTVAISVTNMAVAEAYPDNENKEVIIKKYAPFTDYISEIKFMTMI